MHFFVHHIVSPALRSYVQYILFNYSADKNFSKTIRSFANTNFCLGVSNNSKLSKSANETFSMVDKLGIHSYLTGIYTEPYDFCANGKQDEICIDFTPLGYYQFFRFPAKTFLLNDDVLREAFGKNAYSLFEEIFQEKDFKRRGHLIEQFLLEKIAVRSQPELAEAIYLTSYYKGNSTIAQLARTMRCSERKIHRLFTQHFDISPKEYARVLRFRNAIKLVCNSKLNAASAACELGYADQCHLIREVKYFTGFTPKKLPHCMHNLQDTVLLSVM